MQYCGPTHPSEADLYERFAKIGIGAGVDFDVHALTDDQRAALARGAASGDAKIKKAAGEQGELINGWMMMDPFGNREFFNGDYLKETAVAMIGWGGNDKAEATYPMARKGPDGKPLDGNGKYRLTFQLPIPANAFWSLTMYDTSYDGVGGYMVDNPIDRYIINSLTPGLVDDERVAGLTSAIAPSEANENRGIIRWGRASAPGSRRRSQRTGAPRRRPSSCPVRATGPTIATVPLPPRPAP